MSNHGANIPLPPGGGITTTTGVAVVTVDSSGNPTLNAPITTTNLTTTGNTTLGDAVTDTCAINGATTITTTSASGLTVGRQGATAPQLKIDASAATVATGISVTGAAAASGVTVAAISSGTDENLKVDAKGAGTITLGTTSTGNINLSRTTNFSTDQTFNKEVNHTVSVGTSTTANTIGGSYSVTSGQGSGTAAGGALGLASGASSNGTGVSPGASGAVILTSGTPGTATTGTAGAAGSVTLGGTAGGASTGASSTAGAGTDVNLTGGNGGASSGGGDTGGRGGNIVQQAGTGGSGATAGIAGMIFRRSPTSQKYSATAMTTSATITTAAILGGMITANQGAAGAATYTMPTGTALQSALPAAATTGDSVDFTIVNISAVDAEDVTVAGDTGTTMKGNVTVEANSATTKVAWGVFRAIKTGNNTFDVYRVG